MMTGEWIAQLVAKYVGCSLDERRDELARLVARGVDHEDSIVKVKTNCGMFALGIWHAAGVRHALLDTPYKNEMAISWLVTIAHDLGAVRYPRRDGPPCHGALMHYWLRDGNLTKSHHVEFCLETPGPVDWVAEHAGGGRPNNLIGLGRGDVRWNAGRPLQCWYDPNVFPVDP
jgi:hypothetical protein